MVEQKLGVGFYGAGSIVQNRLVEGAALSKHCVPVGAFDTAQESIAKLLGKYSHLRMYNSPGELLTDGNVQVVAIATPHHFHYEHAKSALEAGKHAWVEKPVATHYDDAKKLGELAEERRLGLWVDSMMRNNWLNQQAARMIAEGAIGRPMRVETSMEFPYCDLKNFRYTESDEEGGGAAWDVGPHCLYMAMYLTGAGRISVTAGILGRQINQEAKPHQSLYMVYMLDNRVVGHSNTSFTTHWIGFEKNLVFRVIGTDGTIEGCGTLFQHSVTGQEGNDQHLVIYDKGGRREIRTPQEGVPNIYAVEFDKLAGPIAMGEKPPIARESIDLVRVIETSLEQAIIQCGFGVTTIV